jgi:hypothetical protein
MLHSAILASLRSCDGHEFLVTFRLQFQLIKVHFFQLIVVSKPPFFLVDKS